MVIPCIQMSDTKKKIFMVYVYLRLPPSPLVLDDAQNGQRPGSNNTNQVADGSSDKSFFQRTNSSFRC